LIKKISPTYQDEEGTSQFTVDARGQQCNKDFPGLGNEIYSEK
jgi:hypothetical protein